MCKVSFCIWVFSSFWMDACIAMYFPLRTAFVASQRFWTFVSSFSLVSMNLFNSSLISWLTLSSFSRMILHLYVFEVLPNLLLWFSSIFKALCSESMQWMIPVYWFGSDLICVPVCGRFWRKFQVHLRRMCIQLSLDVKLYIYLWNPSGQCII